MTAARGSLILLGLSHRTAGLEAREKASLSAAAARAALAALRAEPTISESAVLSTCNRTELYAVADDTARAEEVLGRVLVEHSRIGAPELSAASFVGHDEGAAGHLFRVAASLDSMVVGESEIQAQVGAARDIARAVGTLGPVLDRAFAQALTAGRRVRSRTRVGAGAVSVSSVAVDLARKALGDLSGRRALLVGAGQAAEATARALLGHGVGEIVVANRTPATARRLAARFGGRAADLERLVDEVAAADVVISSTNAARPILDAGSLRQALERRRTLVVIDIAVPRDVDPRAGALPGVRLHNIDHLRRVAEANLNGRRLEAEKAEVIVAAEVRRFAAWRAPQPVT
jgi:glutamyl-tRNA reductase